MPRRPKVVGLGGGKSGGNEKYKIDGTVVPRVKAVQMHDKGKLPGYNTLTVNRKRYLRDDPDPSKKDNVNYKRNHG